MSEGLPRLVLRGEPVQMPDGSWIIGRESLDGALEGWLHGNRPPVIEISAVVVEDGTELPEVQDQ